jgi:N-acyl homoserine lactone hydrolase
MKQTSWAPLALLALTGCLAATHPTAPGALGTPRSSDDLEALLATPGPVTVETVVAADWAVDRAGLIHLEHEKAVAAGLEDGPEPIHIYLHALRHPERGLFLVDTGVEAAMRTDMEHSLFGGMIGAAMHADQLEVRTDTQAWLAAQPAPPAGVFLTHLHLDHISGMRDVPADTPIYAGPGEPGVRAFLHMFVQGTMDDALEGKAALQEWPFEPDPAGRFAGVVDVLGDGSIWALHVPGHTPGSTAYVARTPDGPVLFTGDACHTRWGWVNGVEPGTFSHDRPLSAESLKQLLDLVARHPELKVRLGHQDVDEAQAALP